VLDGLYGRAAPAFRRLFAGVADAICTHTRCARRLAIPLPSFRRMPAATIPHHSAPGTAREQRTRGMPHRWHVSIHGARKANTAVVGGQLLAPGDAANNQAPGDATGLGPYHRHIWRLFLTWCHKRDGRASLRHADHFAWGPLPAAAFLPPPIRFLSTARA